jgi:hypothetical protein
VQRRGRVRHALAGRPGGWLAGQICSVMAVWVAIALHEFGGRGRSEDYGDPYETAWLDVRRYRQFYPRKRMPVADDGFVSW